MPRVEVRKTTIKNKSNNQQKKLTARRTIINGAVARLSANAIHVNARS